ncbi:MAG: Lacal_2735 family protein [Cyclobacteriaceae bacterium]|nr:Lacal_2735 family protein [Cyclobacteriaceae bacterium]
MFSFLQSNPLKKLESKRKKLLEEAMHIQRSGDLKRYASKMEVIDKLEKEIEALQAGKP